LTFAAGTTMTLLHSVQQILPFLRLSLQLCGGFCDWFVAVPQAEVSRKSLETALFIAKNSGNVKIKLKNTLNKG